MAQLIGEFLSIVKNEKKALAWTSCLKSFANPRHFVDEAKKLVETEQLSQAQVSRLHKLAESLDVDVLNKKSVTAG